MLPKPCDTSAALQRGYLPREVPPSIITTQLATALLGLSVPPPTEPTMPVRFSITRAGDEEGNRDT